MAQIAEDLFLLLVDNASAQPGLDKPRRARAVAAAMLLDLAHACRVRPAVAGEPVPAGRLVALDAAGPLDPVTAVAFELLRAKPLAPGRAIKKLSKDSEHVVAGQLERTGQIRRIPQSGKLFGHTPTYPLTHRGRADAARAALMAALFERRPPAPATAAIITMLHTVDGLGALLSLNARGWRWVHARAGEIALGSWVDESPTGLAEVNLAVTASAVRQALTSLH